MHEMAPSKPAVAFLLAFAVVLAAALLQPSAAIRAEPVQVKPACVPIKPPQSLTPSPPPPAASLPIFPIPSFPAPPRSPAPTPPPPQPPVTPATPPPPQLPTTPVVTPATPPPPQVPAAPIVTPATPPPPQAPAAPVVTPATPPPPQAPAAPVVTPATPPPQLPATPVAPATPPPPPAQITECLTPLMGLMPCMDYLTNTSVASPPATCCGAFKSLVDNAPICLCHGLNGDLNKIMPAPMNFMRMMSLPGSCSVPLPMQALAKCATGPVPPLNPPAAPSPKPSQ